MDNYIDLQYFDLQWVLLYFLYYLFGLSSMVTSFVSLT